MMKTNEDKSIIKNTGRGFIYITFAKIWFLITGYVLVFAMPRLLEWSAGGDQELGARMFGLYGLVITGVSFFTNSIVTGSIQSVSRFTAMDETQAAAVRKTGLMVIGSIGLVVAVLYAGLSKFIATSWLKSTDSELAIFMQISAVVIVAYSCYAVFIGSFNGLRKFHRQALFDIAYATFKIALMIGLVIAGFKVMGTVLGFVIAATIFAIVAGFVSKISGEGIFPVKTFLSFAWVILVFTFILNLVLMIDLYVLSGLIPRMALDAGFSGEEAQALMELRAAQYKAAQQLAFIPYQAIIAIAFVIFPLISKVVNQDKDKAKIYVKKTLRFTAILIVGLAVVFAALPEQAVGLVFPGEQYNASAKALMVLPWGICAFGLMTICTTVLNGAGMKWHALWVVLIGVISVLCFNYFLIMSAGFGEESLMATAIGTSLGMGVALFVSTIFVYKKFKTIWPWLTIIRIVFAATGAVTLGHFLPYLGKLMTLVYCIVVLIVYFVVLMVTREFGKDDINQLKQVFKKG